MHLLSVLPLDDGVGDSVPRKVQLLGFGVKVRSSGFRLQASDFSGFMVQASDCRVLFPRKVQLLAEPPERHSNHDVVSILFNLCVALIHFNYYIISIPLNCHIISIHFNYPVILIHFNYCFFLIIMLCYMPIIAIFQI